MRAPSRPVDPRAVDVAALARAGARLEGEIPLAALERLRSAVIDDADGAAVNAVWSAVAEQRAVTGGEPEVWLHLEARVPVRLECQRCLQAMAVPLTVDRRLRFVRGEAEAARLDEESEDDVLELRPRHDLLALVEDELILALPLVPRHEACPLPPAAAGDAGGVAPPAPGRPRRPATASAGTADAPDGAAAAAHPFAALAALRRKSS